MMLKGSDMDRRDFNASHEELHHCSMKRCSTVKAHTQ